VSGDTGFMLSGMTSRDTREHVSGKLDWRKRAAAEAHLKVVPADIQGGERNPFRSSLRVLTSPLSRRNPALPRACMCMCVYIYRCIINEVMKLGGSVSAALETA